jgi:hypothetical protein
MAMNEAAQDYGRDMNAYATTFFSGPMVDVVMRTTESCSKACLAWHEEVMRFAATRLQRDSELGQALVSTRNWADAAKLQQEWAASALRDYTNETTRLFEIAADAGSKLTQDSARAAGSAGDIVAHAARSTMDAANGAAEEARAEVRAAEPRARPRRSQSSE